MLYRHIDYLPLKVSEQLPAAAQEVYRAACNRVVMEYGDEMERADRVGWKAVRGEYEQDEQTGEWRRRALRTKSAAG